MATRTATVKSVEILRGHDDVVPANSVYKRVAVHFQNETGSSVIGGTDTLQIANVGTQIGNFLRTGKTYTVYAGSNVMPWQSGMQGGTEYGFTISMTGNQLDLTPKSQSDWSTNATLPAGAQDRPFAVAFFVKEA